MKVNINANKICPLNRKQAQGSITDEQSPFDGYSSHSLAEFKVATLLTALVWGLMSNANYAHADENTLISDLQTVAESSPQEIGTAITDEHRTRIKFGATYRNPAVAVESLMNNGGEPYLAGIRNVDIMGFEISLKTCNNSAYLPLRENVNYTIIDKSQSLPSQALNSEVRQRFSRGECKTAATDVMTGGVL